jgi:hypothetical protein
MAMVTSTKVDSVFMPFGLIANRRGSAFGQDVHSVWHRRKAQLGAIAAAGGTVQSITGHFYTPRALDRGLAGRTVHRVTRSLEKLPPYLRDRLAPMDVYLVKF